MTYTYITKPVINSNLRQIIDYLPQLDLQDGPWIAGGAARLAWHNIDLGDHDIDIFFANERQWEEYGKFCSKVDIENSFTTNNATTYQFKIKDLAFKLQLIKKDWYRDYESIFNNFDFTCCQFVTDGKNVITTENAINDTNKKILSYNNHTTRTLDTRRVIKYSFYGFIPDKHILKQIIELSHANNLAYNWGQNDY